MAGSLVIWDFNGPGGSFYSALNSYQWGVNNTRFGRYSPQISPGTIYVTRKSDKYSAGLFQYEMGGKPIELMKITLTYPSGGKGGITFNNSYITSIQYYGNERFESITFDFESYKLEF